MEEMGPAYTRKSAWGDVLDSELLWPHAFSTATIANSSATPRYRTHGAPLILKNIESLGDGLMQSEGLRRWEP